MARSGANQLPRDRGLKINSTAAVIQAAFAARGVALVRKALVAQELDGGRLAHLLPDIRRPAKWALLHRCCTQGAAPAGGCGRFTSGWLRVASPDDLAFGSNSHVRRG
ncbi:hypothetical protein [Rhizobium bangladeshense]|uniref:hypothetical protein n=1 Tax=Rhizobium bangladeshense TaxID=1138189 RepID=UPI001FDAA1AD|nr:hypothetical protein [Rhizobium bangladeshense]